MLKAIQVSTKTTRHKKKEDTMAHTPGKNCLWGNWKVRLIRQRLKTNYFKYVLRSKGKQGQRTKWNHNDISKIINKDLDVIK